MPDSKFIAIDFPGFFRLDPGGSTTMSGIQNFALTMPFKSVGSAQGFLFVHAATYNTFCHQRHLLRRANYKRLRSESFAAWSEATSTA